MHVNIVMLCHNRHFLTHQAIRTLHRNTPQELYNLTIIDDASNIPPMVRPADAYLKIGNTKNITGQARNLGIYWSERYFGRGDYLYLTDNDMYFTPGWLYSMIETFHIMNLNHTALTTPLIGGWNHPYLQPKESVVMGNGFSIKSHDAVTGASQLMRWETWDKYGPLDAHAKGVGQSEDWAFCQKIIQDGGRVGSVYPRVVYNCGLTNSFHEASPGADPMLKELREAKLRYPDLYWE